MPSTKASHTPLLPLADGETVPVYHWTPANKNYLNFGDEMGPMIVAGLLRHYNSALKVVAARAGRAKLIAVGSVIQQARSGDVIWGAGVNGKSWPKNLEIHKNLVVASVRGPLTKDALQRYGIHCPKIYGDPGLLFPVLFAQEIEEAIEKLPSDRVGGVIYIPNLNDEQLLDRDIVGCGDRVRRLSPGQHPLVVAAEIAKADLVLSSSLHGLVLADALGVPARPLISMFEPAFKYVDYLLGTGRNASELSYSIDEALLADDLRVASYDADALIASFPLHLLGLDH